MKPALVAITLLLSTGLLGCDGATTPRAVSEEKLKYTNIIPMSGDTGSVISIFGSGFGKDRSAIEVTIDDVQQTIRFVCDTMIRFVVPAGTTDGRVCLKIRQGSSERRTCSEQLFTITKQRLGIFPNRPYIYDFFPKSGRIGDTITVTGDLLSYYDRPSVRVGNVALQLVSWNPQKLVGIVQAGTVTSPITVSANYEFTTEEPLEILPLEPGKEMFAFSLQIQHVNFDVLLNPGERRVTEEHGFVASVGQTVVDTGRVKKFRVASASSSDLTPHYTEGAELQGSIVFGEDRFHIESINISDSYSYSFQLTVGTFGGNQHSDSLSLGPILLHADSNGDLIGEVALPVSAGVVKHWKWRKSRHEVRGSSYTEEDRSSTSIVGEQQNAYLKIRIPK